MTLVELCAGTAAVSLWALARLRPLTGYMGSKRRDAARLVHLLGADRPDRVVLVDAGPWGDVWRTLSDKPQRGAVVQLLRDWDGYGTLHETWPSLLYEPPTDPAARAAQYLCLQARSASCVPVWWSDTTARWESPCRGGLQRAGQRLANTMGRPYARSSGILRARTIADRVDAFGAIDWSRVTVMHGDVGAVAPIEGSVVYFDPPYECAFRYAELLPRERVLEVARRHAAVADLVVVSEAEPLPLEGWHAARLRGTGKPEWLTASRPVQGAWVQMTLGICDREVAA